MNGHAGEITVSPALSGVACPFRDRSHAGRFLSEIVPLGALGKPVLVAATLEGLRVAQAMAATTRTRVEFFPVLPLTAAWSRALVYGAVAFDGSVVLEQYLIEQAGLSAADVRAAIREQTPRFRELFVHALDTDTTGDLRGHVAVLVDDGGAAMPVLRAAIGAARNARATSVVVATAAASPQVLRQLSFEADRIYCASARRDKISRIYERGPRAPMRTIAGDREQGVSMPATDAATH